MKRSLPWIFAALLLSGGAQAQVDQSQLVRPPDAADLNTYLARLSANPRDVAALIGAGEAALALDDPRAAAGFFARADAIASGNGRIKAGLGRVMLKLQNPGEALRLFDQAARLGYPDATILADRGLARDMTGDQAGAQRDYQAALQRTPDDAELIRRYAASLGIAGQVEASDKVMQPLFYKSDRAAWRYRAFILAMNNRQADAQKIAEQTMPAQLAAAITPYMRKMPYLSPAQKAAAVHFGHFPTQIGTTIAAIVATPPAPGFAPPATAKAPPVAVATAPTSPAQDRRARRAEQQRQRREATRLARADALRPKVVQPAAAPTPTPAPTPAVQQPAPQPVQQPPAPVQMVQSTPAAPGPVQSAPQQQQVATASPQVQGPPAPGFESVDTRQPAAPAADPPAPATQLNAITLAQASVPAPSPALAPSSPVVQPTPSPAPTPTPAVAPSPPQPDPQATRTLADIIRAIDVPEAERQSAVAAVDLAEIERIQAARRAERLAAADKVKKAAAAKAKAEADAKAKKEADAKAKKEAEEKKRLADNPARNWLQIATGASKSALGFTLKTMRKKYDALAPQSAWVASWGRTNRLVVGPFASFTRAKTLETRLKGEGADVFAWQSDAGEVVERLGGE